MSDESFADLRAALAAADRLNLPMVTVDRAELGRLLMDHDRFVEAFRAGGWSDLAELRRGRA